MLAGSLEPGMLDRGMTWNQIEQDLEASAMRLLEQAGQVRVRAIARRNFIIIGHVITRIQKRRSKTRVQPDRVYAQPFEIVQLLDDTRNVAAAVSIFVIITLRIDLVKNCPLQPFGT